MVGERTGTFVVRAWVEEKRLTARITRLVGLDRTEPVSTAVSSREEMYEEMTSWLDELEGRSLRDEPVTRA